VAFIVPGLVMIDSHEPANESQSSLMQYVGGLFCVVTTVNPEVWAHAVTGSFLQDAFDQMDN